jgi:hypothetical protein
MRRERSSSTTVWRHGRPAIGHAYQELLIVSREVHAHCRGVRKWARSVYSRSARLRSSARPGA